MPSFPQPERPDTFKRLEKSPYAKNSAIEQKALFERCLDTAGNARGLSVKNVTAPSGPVTYHVYGQFNPKRPQIHIMGFIHKKDATQFITAANLKKMAKGDKYHAA